MFDRCTADELQSKIVQPLYSAGLRGKRGKCPGPLV